MTESNTHQDLAALWESALRVYPLYSQLAKEFALEVDSCPDLEAAVETPDQESVAQAQQWLQTMDERIQTHQLRQFLQTSSIIDQDAVLALLQHLLGSGARNDATRDKIDFMLVQYFNLALPIALDDSEIDLPCVAGALQPLVGIVELKVPVWLNALDRVLESARKCTSLDELLHGGILVQGRKIKTQAGDLFYLPIALVAFTRFGYLMRRSFFHLMHNDLNAILEGLDELQAKGVTTLDCRRAQFSAQEPVDRLRMVCQSWKVMFQAEYSSGQPLRLLVDLKASVEQALGRPASATDAQKPAAASTTPKLKAKAAAAGAESLEFEVSSGVPGWNDEGPSPAKKK
jgi:nucleotide-binding universal stress UspA family protein